MLLILHVELEFCLTLHCEMQLQFIENVELQKRMLFVDSSGGLVKMTKQMNDEYQRVRLKLKLIRLIKINY